jgi:NADPH:quinone reductase-like Zn-dependent oxidoreductase
MKSFEIQEFGVENLVLADRPEPSPGAREVLVRLKAASLNYRDLTLVQGTYNPKLKRPLVPLSDGVGVVEKIGPGVTRFAPGDRVAGCFFQQWVDGPNTKEKGRSALGGGIDGVAREYAVFSEDGLVAIPASLTDEEAAALPCAAVTAWHALFEERQVLPGETVLLLGTGGVSIFALQLAVLAGLRVIITSSSDAKLAQAKALGAHLTINYKATPEWGEEARKLSGGEGVDHVVEVGGSDTMAHSLRAVRTQGTISVIGALSGREGGIGPAPVLMNSIRMQGIYVGSRAMFERLLRAIELHQLKPVIDRTFPFADLKIALLHMESKQHFGKICLKF